MQSRQDQKWLGDTGATVHCTAFSTGVVCSDELKPKQTVIVGNGEKVVRGINVKMENLCTRNSVL